MSIIKIKCVDQTLTITNRPLIASGGQQENTMIFEFCSLWDGYTNTAVFYRNANEVYNVLIVDNQCDIPHEVLQEEGKFYFGVFGINGATRRTSEVLTYEIKKGSYILGQEPQAPTQDVYEQIMNLHNQITTQYQNIFTNINSLVADAVLQGVVNQRNENELVKFWFGTAQEYATLGSYDSNVVYIVTDNDLAVLRVSEYIRNLSVFDIFESNDNENILPVVKSSTESSKYKPSIVLYGTGRISINQAGLYYVSMDTAENRSFMIDIPNLSLDFRSNASLIGEGNSIVGMWKVYYSSANKNISLELYGEGTDNVDVSNFSLKAVLLAAY